jgi:hypothetical protein
VNRIVEIFSADTSRASTFRVEVMDDGRGSEQTNLSVSSLYLKGWTVPHYAAVILLYVC